nr:hypothetical protein [Fusarium oxysporum]
MCANSLAPFLYLGISRAREIILAIVSFVSYARKRIGLFLHRGGKRGS